MALDNNTQITDRNTINNWFKTGLKPNQQQFWSTWASFWHKSDTLPIGSIKGLGDLLDGKAEENHTHDIYATNDATSLNSENVTAWKKILGVANLEFDDDAIKITSDYNRFNLRVGATQSAFNSCVDEEFGLVIYKPTEDGTVSSFPYVVGIDAEGKSAQLPAGDLGKNFANTDLVVTTNRKHTGTASVEFGFPFNCSNPSIRYSGLADKSADATFNQLLGVDSNGYTAKVGLNALTNAMSKSTDSQKDAWRNSLLKTNENYSSAIPIINAVIPPVIDSTINYKQYITLVGTNLYVNPSTSIVKMIRFANEEGTPVPEEIYDITEYEVFFNRTSILSIAYDFSTIPNGRYYFEIINNGLISVKNTSTVFLLSSSNLGTKDIDIQWQEESTYDRTLNAIVNNNYLSFQNKSGVDQWFGNDGYDTVRFCSVNSPITQEDIISGFIIQLKWSTDSLTGWNESYPIRFNLFGQNSTTAEKSTIDRVLSVGPIGRLESQTGFQCLPFGNLSSPILSSAFNVECYIIYKNGVFRILTYYNNMATFYSGVFIKELNPINYPEGLGVSVYTGGVSYSSIESRKNIKIEQIRKF